MLGHWRVLIEALLGARDEAFGWTKDLVRHRDGMKAEWNENADSVINWNAWNVERIEIQKH